MMKPHEIANQLYDAATPIIRINSLTSRKWRRNDQKQYPRTGPWHAANYDVLDRDAWLRKHACIYFVGGDDGLMRYTGISRNGIKDRWREAPAVDPETGKKLPKNELHHSQCWPHIEREYQNKPGCVFEVRTMAGAKLASVLKQLGPPLSGLLVLDNDHEGLVSAVERWICNNQLVTWNSAMTKIRNIT